MRFSNTIKKGRASMKETQVKEKFIQLRAEGLSLDKISTELNTSKPTLIKWQRELEKQISEAKLYEFESLFEQYRMLKKQRVEVYGERLQKVRNEIQSKLDAYFKDLSITELLEMQEKLEAKLKAEMDSAGYTEGGTNFDVFGGGKRYSIE